MRTAPPPPIPAFSTEQQLIDATGIQVGDNLYGFSTKEKSDQLLAQMPYLDVAVVTRQAPGTVIIRVQPAVERFRWSIPAAGWC